MKSTFIDKFHVEETNVLLEWQNQLIFRRWTAYSVYSCVKERKRGARFRFPVRKWRIFLIHIKIFLYLPGRSEATCWVLAALRFKRGPAFLSALLTLPLSQPCCSESEPIHGELEILLTRALLTYLAKSHPGQRPCSSLFCWEFVLWRERLKWVGKLLVILLLSLEKH